MSEEKKDTVSGESDNESDQDWGDDWESAFQAEEELFSEEELEEELQADDLDESWDEVLSVTTDTENAPATSKNPQDVQQPSNTQSDPTDTPENSHAGPGFLEKTKEKLSALPLYIKIASAGIPVLILILALLPVFTSKDLSPEITLPENQQVTEKRSALPEAPEKIRSKWPLTSFFIPVNSDKDPSTVFLNLDLTMILLLDAEEELPSDKVSKARELVYQFYINRPLYELRRFALARGEMNKKLRNWIRKQWPDVELETIVFDHYELI